MSPHFQRSDQRRVNNVDVFADSIDDSSRRSFVVKAQEEAHNRLTDLIVHSTRCFDATKGEGEIDDDDEHGLKDAESSISISIIHYVSKDISGKSSDGDENGETDQVRDMKTAIFARFLIWSSSFWRISSIHNAKKTSQAYLTKHSFLA